MSIALERPAARGRAAGLPGPAPLWWWLALAPALLLLAGGAASVAWLLYEGVAVWGNDWPAVWGFEMIAYGWWLGLATGTMFVSAVLAVAGVPWRGSIHRLAETLSILSIAGAGIYPILHLGRPWFFYWLFPYPNTLQLWPQFKSPLLWDFMSILTMVTASLLFWLMGMIPDLAAMRDRAGPGPLGLFYGILALGFRGAGRQWRHYRAAYATMAALMVPLVISVQSIGALDFAGGELPGWHTTQLPPMYICIAGLQGSAAVLGAALLFGGRLGVRPLEDAARRWLCRMMLAASWGLAYCYAMEAFSAFTSPDMADRHVMAAKFADPVYFISIALNVLVPQALWLAAARRSGAVLGVVAACVLTGAWLEHYGTTVTSQVNAEIPSGWGFYGPSLWDWLLFGGTLGLAAAGLLVALRLLPMRRVWARA